MPTSLPTVSVILPAYNAERYVGDAIDSLLAQTYRCLELIVVDDGSTDRTNKILRGYGERVRVVINKKNQGIPNSRNKGIAQASGEYIAMHDADDTSISTRIEKQAAYLQANPDCAMVGTDRARVKPDGKARTYHTKSKINTNPVFDDLLKHNCMIGASLMIRKSVLDELGGYAPLDYAEDYDLALRVAKKYKVANIAERLYLCTEHPDSATKRNVDKVMLFHLLAQNRNTGKIGEDKVQAILSAGIDSYYAMLNKAEREVHHYRLSQQYRHQKRHCEALEHLRTLAELRKPKLKMKLRMRMLSLKCKLTK